MKIEGYLTESKLVDLIENYCQIKSLKFLGKQLRFTWAGRFAFDCGYEKEGQTILIEYDGAKHYECNSTIERDRRKDKLVKEQGFEIIRFPYWLQFSQPSFFSTFFNDEFEIEQEFPHGFITRTVSLPGSFCYAGMKRFKREMRKYDAGNFFLPSIYGSLLWQQIHRGWDSDLVFGSLDIPPYEEVEHVINYLDCRGW